MNKNTVYIISVGSKPEYDISIESWRRWCDKNDVQLFLLEEPILPMEDMHIIWQRYYMFDIFDNNDIKSNQTLIVDADTIIHPNCDNFFEKTENIIVFFFHCFYKFFICVRNILFYNVFIMKT